MGGPTAQTRLGHARVEITLNTHAHLLPDVQKQAPATIGTLQDGC
jgi:hypothetical protein